MKINVIVIILSLCIHLFAFTQNNDQEQLNRLTTHLSIIQQEACLVRNLEGGTLIGVGLFVGIGGVVLFESLDVIADQRFLYDSIFIGMGALAVVSGVIELSMHSEYEILADKYLQLPEDSPENVRKKINRGEVYLERLAHKAEGDRYLHGGILIAVGLAQMAVYFFDPFEQADDDYGLNDIFLIQGIVSCSVGIIRLFVKSTPENEYRNYREWKKEHGIDFVFMPTPYGITAGIKISY